MSLFSLRPLWFCCCFAAVRLSAADSFDAARYATVQIPPVKTSIYIGSVTLTAPPFLRHNEAYSSTYSARVFPYFFYNEHGTLSIRVTDEMLRQLARGQPVDFTGQGINSDGEARHVEGRATPTDAISGRIKVRIFVSKRIQLIFNTSYRFAARSVPAENSR